MIDNLFHNIPGSLPEEIFETLLQSNTIRIERIVSHGHASVEGFWYDQQDHEFVLLLQGIARLQFEDEVIELCPGDWVNIPAHRRHRVEWTAPDEKTIWLAVFYG